jgi:choline-sulfatase
VVLISVDTLRADRLGAYGATSVETPAIDSLASAGVRFENAYSPVPLTLPAHWTILSGVEPWRHGVVDNGMIPQEPPATLAERLAQAGYDTAAFVSAFVLHRTFGLARGFARYDDGPAGDAALDQTFHGVGRADERVDKALRWLNRDRRQPFFLWLHLYDPHAPYDPPEGFRARYEGRPYDGEVAFVDTQIARILAALERSEASERTLVILLSDHGESLGEHGERTHGVFLYDSTLRVPLIFRLPGTLTAGEVRTDAVSLADVAPTISRLLGLPPAGRVDGRDIFGSDRSERRLGAISEYPRRKLGWANLIAVREAGWKYIRAPRPELFDLALDPAEKQDRIGEQPTRAAGLARAAEDIGAALGANRAPQSAAPAPEVRARLSALGYVSGSRPSSGPAPDPKDVIATMNELDKAYQRMAEGRLGEAEAALRQLSGESALPQAPMLEARARLARMQGRNEEAERTYLRLLARDPTDVSALAQLVVIARDRGHLDIATERARRLVATAPTDGGASRLLGEVLLAAGRSGEAEAEWRRGLARAPAAGWLRLGLARLLLSSGRSAEGQRELERITADENQPGDVRTAAERLAKAP